MQSIVKMSRTLLRKRCLEEIIKRSIRLMPLVIDMPPVYYQTIDQKLNDINYYQNPKHLKDIGFDNNSNFKLNFISVRKLLKNKSIIKDLDDLDEENKLILNYKLIYDKWLLSEDGINSIIDLANHYSIFRDLFPPLPPLPPKSPIEDLPPKPIYFFEPLVPIHVQFCVNESQIDTNSDENNDKVSETKSEDIIISSPVFRGNLILSQNCMNAPNVVIDSSAINGIDNVDNYENREECGEESSGRIKLLNDEQNYYTLGLINLDSHFGEESNVCHWLITNIHNKNKVTNSETIIKYLPVYGIRGFGYHRFVFVLYQHNKPLSLEKINDFDLHKRKFDAFKFMTSQESVCKITPIGLSWFQSTWDYSSQKVFYQYLGIFYSFLSLAELEIILFLIFRHAFTCL
jgi:hypothetical protein